MRLVTSALRARRHQRPALSAGLLGAVLSAFSSSVAASPMDASAFYQLSASKLSGDAYAFSSLKGKAVLITNIASKWGATKRNYQQLVELDGKYPDLEILAFPCNQFGKQEPGSAADIQAFAARFGAKFNMMAKINVNGPETHEVWSFLKSATGGANIRWNFATKFLINRSGDTVTRYEGKDPKDIEGDIATTLKTTRSEL